MPEGNNREHAPKILLGMTLEVLKQDNQVIFLGRVAAIGHEVIRLVNASGDEVPPVVYNTKIKLRGFLPDMRTIICSGVVRGNTEQFWQIEELESQYIREGRAFFRQNVSTKVKVMCVNSMFAPDRKGISSEKMADCNILDISGGGARISCKEQYQVDDWLFLMDANFIPAKEVFSFTCKIRRVEPQKNGMNIYGCQFEGLKQKELDRLIETIFALQREEVQRRQRRNGR